MINFKLYVCLFLLFLCVGCGEQKNDLLPKNTSTEITLKTTSGFYLCADRDQGNQLLANRENVGVWEKFKLHRQKDNTIALQASDFSFVGTHPSNEGILSAGHEITNPSTVFIFIEKDAGRVVLKTPNHKFVVVNANQQLQALETEITKATEFILETVHEPRFSYFSNQQLIPLITGLILLVMSLIIFQYNENRRISLVLLVLGGLSLRIFVALLNTYLTLWDEQFHALVAKNMMEHPFHPMLYKNPVLAYDASNWTAGHTWLHKQPLFLWQMALSMKIFGVNVFGLRFPSILMSTLVIFFIYKIGSLTVNKKTGYYGGLLFALSNFALELTAGVIHTDHNDVAFLFYVVGSVWAWVEYEHADLKRKTGYLLLIGVFSGCAILVKWLTGFLVFSGWGLSILLIKERRNNLKRYVHLLFSFGIALLLFLPWQLYILNAFPELSRHEYLLNSRHFYEVIEGHGGDFWWHFNVAESIYGLHPLLLVFCVSIFYLSIKNKVFKVAFLSYVLLVYIFFGIAATKMIAFTYSVSFLMYLSIAAVIAVFFEFVLLRNYFHSKKLQYFFYTSICIAVISALNLNIEKIQEQHTLFKKDNNSYLGLKLKAVPVITSLSKKIKNIDNYVVLNCHSEDNIPIMFFNDVVAAYPQIPDSTACEGIKRKGYKIAVFENTQLPSYLMNDKDVVKLPGY